jgi:hypothetical protein
MITVGAGAGTASAGNSGDTLKQARAKYNSAQSKCVKHHQLKQLPRILKFANEIKKLGGGKIKKKQLYKCIRFSIYLHDHLTLKGTYHGGGWTYTHSWDYSLFDLTSGEALKPDFKGATSHDVESSGELTMADIVKGGASSKSDKGSLSATQRSEGHKGGASGYSATVSINPSAKDPRRTIEVTLALNPPLERYHTDYTGGGGGSSNETGQVWIYAYNWVHRRQKPPGLPAFVACTQTVFTGLTAGLPDGTKQVADHTFESGGSMPLGTARNGCASVNGTNAIPDTVRYDPWTIPHLNVSDSTRIVLDHAP